MQERLADLQRRIARLQIHTKKLLRGGHAGQYITRRIGTGSEFDQLRDYQVGDNVRAIDWKSSARSNKLIVRSYVEDRNRTVVLLVDCSRSGNFGSGNLVKQTVVQDISAMIAFAAEQTRDRIGALFFSNTVNQVIPLGAGRMHTALLTQQIMTYNAAQKQEATSFAAVCAAVREQIKRQALVVVVSDCLSSEYEELTSLAQQHEVVVLRVYDPIERELPEGLLVVCQDPESGDLVEGTDPFEMAELRGFMRRWYQEQNHAFKKAGIAVCDISIQESYDAQLVQFFAHRGLK